MTLKVTYERDTGRILGAQGVGFGGVDKRIDVLAAAVRAKMTDADLADLDLCYAPPYSSAKDPVNMAGYVIGNVRGGIVKQHEWKDVEAISADGNAILLDVQTAGEFAEAHLKGAVNIPVDERAPAWASWIKPKRSMSTVTAGCAAISPAACCRQKGSTVPTFRAASAFIRSSPRAEATIRCPAISAE